MKKILSVLLALLMVFALVGCGAKEEAGTDTADSNLVGVSMPTKSLQRWIQDGDNMKAQLEAAGYEVDLQYAGDNDIPTQVSQCQNMIANGAKVLVIAAIDGSSLGTVLDEAKQAGVAIIAYDRLIMNSDAVSYYASFDNYKVGTLQGTYIETALDLANAGDKTYNIEFCAGDPGDNNAGYFFNGAYDVLGKYVDNGTLVNVSGQHTFAEVATEGWSTATCQARVENIINSFYADTQLDAVCCSNDSTALGAINAIAANYKGGNTPVITGQDCDKANVPHIIDGTQSMAVFKDTRTLAERTVKMINSIMSGNAPETNATYPNGTYDVPSYLCDPIVCTADNYKEVLLDSGYYTAADIGQ
ncbi:MAG: sugar ABC transporter substrate-binding protein [Erysipelotrichaceae bacterium]|nr:sugar ABC transporter substrate-binding protein [Erysipelotrichaceae bacterium]